jgi:hypothetical protein
VSRDATAAGRAPAVGLRVDKGGLSGEWREPGASGRRRSGAIVRADFAPGGAGFR